MDYVLWFAQILVTLGFPSFLLYLSIAKKSKIHKEDSNVFKVYHVFERAVRFLMILNSVMVTTPINSVSAPFLKKSNKNWPSLLR